MAHKFGAAHKQTLWLAESLFINILNQAGASILRWFRASTELAMPHITSRGAALHGRNVVNTFTQGFG